uniref:Histone-lysine N-methyltransferase SETMAR n=1 Tax=Heterorhabditis bacteriophora TaxID=37862 RepID=A0A1I7XUM4_HETBA
MVTVWWLASEVIHYNFLCPGETITAQKYCHEIDKVHQELQRLRPALVNRKGPLLLHDNARPHVSQMTLQNLNELAYETLPYPVYLPDLCPTNYHFLRRFDNFLQEKVSNNKGATQKASEEFIDSRTLGSYATGINKLVYCWQKCVDYSGSYFV